MTGRGARGWIAACGALLACTGCGFKGPLYLPAHNTKVVTHAAQATPATAAKKKATSSPQSPGTQSPSTPQSPSLPQAPASPQAPSSSTPPPPQ